MNGKKQHRYFNSQSNDVEVQGGLNLADRLRRELNRASYSSSNSANGVTCTTECRLMPGHSGRTQAELDALAQDMTNQILLDLRSGKIHHGQINSPNWFEQRVADKLSEFHQNHDQQFSMQTQQQQQQHQSSQFQQQSQTQQSYGFAQPVGGSSYQRVVEEHHKQLNGNSAFPAPVSVFHGATILHRNNCTDQVHQNTYPFFNGHNQFNQRVESSRQINSAPTYIAPIVGGDSSYRVSQSYQRKEQHVPQVSVVIPAQNSYTREYKEEQREIQRHQPRPIYAINQQNHASSHVESSKVHNVQIITPAPAPVITRQDIIDHFYESEVVPNYKPRVTIDQNTKFHELEVHNRQQYRPVIQPVTAQSHFETNEQHIDQKFHQNHPIVIQPQVSNQVTQEEMQISHQVTQRPIVYPQQNIVTQTQSQDIQQSIKENRPQYPVFSHATNVQSYNESHQTNHQNTQVIQRPSGQTVTTIKESHFVNILPQPANQYFVQYNEEEYNERLNSIQQELLRLGYGILTQEEYNSTISSGGFIHNGYKYLYNPAVQRYEKTERTEITEEEYHSLLHDLRNELRQLGTIMSESQYNQTIIDGYFEVNGVRYVYDSESGTYHRQEMSNDQYEILRQRIQQESDRYGWGLTVYEINQTIATGNLVINGHQYSLDKQTGLLIEGQEVEISEQEYRTILRRLQEQLQQLGFKQMTGSEYNQTIKSGFFVRNGQKYQYNADIGRYEKVELSEEEYYSIVRKLKETLQRLNYRQMSEYETNQTIASGSFLRGGYQWTYNVETGEATAIRNVQPFEELSEVEYESIKRRIQTLLRSLGYPEMSVTEIEATITSGTFLRGGNHWVYQPATGEFVRMELTESEYNHRLDRLNEILNRLGIRKSESEKHDIIYRGCFYFGGYRYEYDITSGSFVQMHMTDEEYEQRKRQLLQQLLEIGYGTMTDSECRTTIYSGVFYYGGHEWVYNYQSGKYEMGKVIDKENGIVDDNYFTNINLDSTHYETSANETDKDLNVDKTNPNARPKEIISKDRGDQPPQTFEEDYDEEETRRPAPIQVPTQAAIPRPIFTTPMPAVFVSTVSSMSSHYEQQNQQVYVVPPPETEIEQSYHHKKTTYSQTYVSFCCCCR